MMPCIQSITEWSRGEIVVATWLLIGFVATLVQIWWFKYWDRRDAVTLVVGTIAGPLSIVAALMVIML
jgi:hypothetical protein